MTWYQYVAKLLADRREVLVCSGDGSRFIVPGPDAKPLYTITKAK